MAKKVVAPVAKKPVPGKKIGAGKLPSAKGKTGIVKGAIKGARKQRTGRGL